MNATERAALLLVLASGGLPVFAIDHNNLEAGRPLRFDDASTIAYRERALEFGLGIGFPRRRAAQYTGDLEFKYGLAPNRDITIAFDPSIGGGTDSRSNKFNPNDVQISYLESLQREIGNAPALAYRIDLGLPTGRDSEGVDLRARGIITKTVRQYDKLHLNVDLNVTTRAAARERKVTTAAVLGYSAPLGYPRRFDQTFVAEIALTQSPVRGEGWTGTVGFGFRKQVGVRSVVDIGFESDLTATKGAPRTPYRLVVGHSAAF